MKNRRAFTLIELLVVVAIIALLIAILLPSLGKAKTLSVRTKCLAVLKNWGTCINTYAQDNNGTFFIKDSGQGWNSTGAAYATLWASKFSQTQRVCPGSDSAAIAANTTSYCMVQYNPRDNFMLFYASGAGHSMAYRLISFRNLSNKVLMFDTAPGAASPWISSMTDGPSLTPPNLQNALLARHSGTGGVLFLDSHAETHPFADYAINIPSASNPVPAAETSKPWTEVQ